MKQYLICYINHANNNELEQRAIFNNYSDAKENLEVIAKEYVQEFQGKQQVNVCKIESSPDEISNDITKQSGMYILVKDTEVLLYEKITGIVPGIFWDAYKTNIKHSGTFKILEATFIDISASSFSRSSNIRSTNISKNNTLKLDSSPFLTELKSFFNNGNTKKLKPLITKNVKSSNDTIPDSPNNNPDEITSNLNSNAPLTTATDNAEGSSKISDGIWEELESILASEPGYKEVNTNINVNALSEIREIALKLSTDNIYTIESYEEIPETSSNHFEINTVDWESSPYSSYSEEDTVNMDDDSDDIYSDDN